MKLLPNYIEMLNFIEVEIDKVRITTSETEIKAAATLLVTTVDHAQGIRFLLERTAYPSASALMRVLFETYIRAMWLWKCADENQVDSFINEDKVVSKTGKNIYFRDLVKAVEQAHGFPEYLSKIQENTWKGLNSLTHGGSIQLRRNFDGQTIKHCYDEEIVDELIEFSTMLTCMAFAGLMDLCDHQNGPEVSGRLFELVEPWALNEKRGR
jgi:hypothetical protein